MDVDDYSGGWSHRLIYCMECCCGHSKLSLTQAFAIASCRELGCMALDQVSKREDSHYDTRCTVSDVRAETMLVERSPDRPTMIICTRMHATGRSSPYSLMGPLHSNARGCAGGTLSCYWGAHWRLASEDLKCIRGQASFYAWRSKHKTEVCLLRAVSKDFSAWSTSVHFLQS